jgi:NitT/TauT family transport system substrate-binding protein
MNTARLFTFIGLASGLLLAACGGAAPVPASAPPPKPPAASLSAAPRAPQSAKPSASAEASIAPVPPGTILASYSELTAINLPLWIAVDAGLFKKNGLTVDARLIESSLGVGALLSNEVKFAAMGGSETLAAAVGGADLVVLATLSPVYPYTLEVNASIKTAQDLKGKKLGISRIGSSSDSGTRAALKKLGLDADKDVQLVQVGSLAARTAALLSGALDGAVSALPDTLEMEARGFHPLLDLAAERLPAVNNTLVARRSWISDNKDTTQKYLDSVVEGIARAKKDKALSVGLIKKYLKERGGDDKALEATYEFNVNEIFRIPPVTTPDLFQDSITQLSEKTAKAKDFDIKTLIDNSFVENAASRGVGKN